MQIQLHVTSCLALIRAAEDELIQNKVGASCRDPHQFARAAVVRHAGLDFCIGHASISAWDRTEGVARGTKGTVSAS